jgi:hypothetical protein
MRPYELYVRFLVTKGISSYEEVNNSLSELGLRSITQQAFETQYHIVHDNVPEPISKQIFSKRYEGTFLKWMKHLDVQELWTLEKPFITPETAKYRLVYDINYDPALMLTLNALIVKGCNHVDIVQDINMKFSYMLKEKHIEIYQKFFCNPQIMKRSDWKDYIRAAGDQEKSILFTALTEPIDILKSSLDLPSRVDVSGSLQQLLVASYHKAKHYLKMNDVSANREARAWVGTTLALADKYQKYSKADIGDFAKSVQMEFDLINTDFQTPDEELLAELRMKNEPKGDDRVQKEGEE